MIGHLKGNAVAYLALFVALGGVSWAAVKLPKNSVGANQVKSNAIRSAEVKNRALLARDFKAGQLPAGERGPAGQRGPQGGQGQPGAPGADGAVGPTFADVGGDGTLDPAATPTGGLTPAGQRKYVFTTPTPGRVLLEWRGRIGITCPMGGDAQVGIYLESTTPLPNSGREILGSADEVSLAGLTGVLPAGVHTAYVRSHCPTGTAGAASAGTFATWSAVLVGG
jgi:hypothetical protein